MIYHHIPLKDSLILKFSVIVFIVIIFSTGIIIFFCFNFLHPMPHNIYNIIFWVFFINLISMLLLAYIFKRAVLDVILELTDDTSKLFEAEGHHLKKYQKPDEIGQLAKAIGGLEKGLREKQEELNRQKNEYKQLFEMVPCIITLQDRNFKLIGYNQEFAKRFDPTPGDYCYIAYKKCNEKCADCPVEKTFKDGQFHYSEEKGINKDGSISYWIVKTAPMINDNGDVIAAMELSLDITHRKQLEEHLLKSEQKYMAIFNNIPNPIFMLDADSLDILDCNDRVSLIYGYRKTEMLGSSFLSLFPTENQAQYAQKVKKSHELNRIKQTKKNGENLIVNIWISPCEYPGRKVFLVITSDITKRLESQIQLIQAGKMATLGEMATGVAHELNQPLSVIKTASSFFMKKMKKREDIAPDILLTMSEQIDSHVDRAANIINHMRQFGRKSDMVLERVNVNHILQKTFEIFSQQLKLREIQVEWNLDSHLPEIMAEAGQLEQVFINLLINARDAIEDLVLQDNRQIPTLKKIMLSTETHTADISIQICDTGPGIPENLIEKIFEPFFTTKKVGQGTGIGLSISYGIIQDLKGSLKAVNQKQGGACFIIKLPVR